jgi:hypothetical protein
VWAVEGISEQPLSGEHALPALGLCQRCDDRHLAAELIGGASLAPDDAIELWRVQRKNLWPALALILVV